MIIIRTDTQSHMTCRKCTTDNIYFLHVDAKIVTANTILIIPANNMTWRI